MLKGANVRATRTKKTFDDQPFAATVRIHVQLAHSVMKKVVASSIVKHLIVVAVLTSAMIRPAAAQDYIKLSTGGGVTGNATVFRISRSGEIAKAAGSIEPEFSMFSHLRKGKTKKYFRQTRALFEKQTFNHPGNLYTSIALVEGGKESKIVWGDATQKTPGKALKVYQRIQGSLDKLTFRKELRK